MANDISSIPPVYLINSNLPTFDMTPYNTVEICRAAERVTGQNTIDGAEIRGLLWRIYPLTMHARCELLTSSLTLRGVQVTLYNKNPLVVQGRNGEMESPTTKVIVGGVPYPFNNEAIEHALTGLPNVTKRSAVFYERARDEDKKLTNFKTGRRFMYIDVPETPLPKRLKIGNFNATIFHYEQKLDQTCGKCLELHPGRSCDRPIRCRQCLEYGHRAGAPECSSSPLDSAATNTEEGQGAESSNPAQHFSTVNQTNNQQSDQPLQNQSTLPTQTQSTSSLPTPPSHLNPDLPDIPPPKHPEPSSTTSSERGRSKMKQTTIQLLATNESQLASAREIESNARLSRITQTGSGSGILKKGGPAKLLEARRPSIPGEEIMTVLEDKLRRNWERDHSRSPRAKRARDEDTDKTKKSDTDHETGH